MNRVKWDVEKNGIEDNGIEGHELDLGSPLARHAPSRNSIFSRDELMEWIEEEAFTSHFQPIFSAQSGGVQAYEALARLKPGWAARAEAHWGCPINIGTVFQSAGEQGCLSILDLHCRENALHEAARLGLADNGDLLFVNVCPQILTDSFHRVGVTDRLVEEYGFSKNRIVFELTEEVAVRDYKLFRMAVAYYRDQGYKIAIDDFGVGYGGLKMLSLIEPDYVKIDRHFISRIDSALVRHNLVDMIATACHRMGIKVIAEGIEREEELSVVTGMGIDFLQGFYLGRPTDALCQGDCQLLKPKLDARGDEAFSETKFIGQIARMVEPLLPQAPLREVFDRFINDASTMSLPIVENGQVLGVLQRARFFEQEFLGKHGYGHLLNAGKTALQLAQTSPMLSTESHCTLEQVSQRIPARQVEALYDDIVVLRNGKYLGTVAVSVLLEAITQRSLLLAQGANPLTKLPGNEFIQREIETRIAQNMLFDVCYIDIDFFKPFNDTYGFEKGDQAIQALASILRSCLHPEEMVEESFAFVGHIGGDDFILVCRPQASMALAERVVRDFERVVRDFEHSRETLHPAADIERGFYRSVNRRGEADEFPLLSLSIGIVSTEVNRLESYAELASLAAEVKRAAKATRGSSIVRDQRLGAAA
jgi:diguanylate cyclase (GGDEF)-like protein